MPCDCSGYPPPREEVLADKMTAVLCAVIEEHGKEILDSIDWQEAGVKRDEFEEWWVLHQERDRKRRALEDQERQKKAARDSARAKLSKEEKAALGL